MEHVALHIVADLRFTPFCDYECFQQYLIYLDDAMDELRGCMKSTLDRSISVHVVEILGHYGEEPRLKEGASLESLSGHAKQLREERVKKKFTKKAMANFRKATAQLWMKALQSINNFDTQNYITKTAVGFIGTAVPAEDSGPEVVRSMIKIMRRVASGTKHEVKCCQYAIVPLTHSRVEELREDLKNLNEELGAQLDGAYVTILPNEKIVFSRFGKDLFAKLISLTFCAKATLTFNEPMEQKGQMSDFHSNEIIIRPSMGPGVMEALHADWWRASIDVLNATEIVVETVLPLQELPLLYLYGIPLNFTSREKSAREFMRALQTFLERQQSCFLAKVNLPSLSTAGNMDTSVPNLRLIICYLAGSSSLLAFQLCQSEQYLPGEITSNCTESFAREDLVEKIEEWSESRAATSYNPLRFPAFISNVSRQNRNIPRPVADSSPAERPAVSKQDGISKKTANASYHNKTSSTNTSSSSKRKRQETTQPARSSSSAARASGLEFENLTNKFDGAFELLSDSGDSMENDSDTLKHCATIADVKQRKTDAHAWHTVPGNTKGDRTSRRSDINELLSGLDEELFSNDFL